MKKKIFISLFAMIVCMFAALNICPVRTEAAAKASGSCGTNVRWELSYSGVFSISGKGSMTDFTNGSSTPWNKYKNEIKQVNIGYGVNNIGAFSFVACNNLTGISIASTVNRIGNGAFEYCSGIASLYVPGSVYNIGKGAFQGCRGLYSVYLAYGIRNIDSWAFQECTGMGVITIPGSVTNIGMEAFSACSGLYRVNIQEGVSGIGTWAFESCSSLSTVAIPKSMRYINDGAFSGCSMLSKVEYTGGLQGWNSISIGGENGYLTKAANASLGGGYLILNRVLKKGMTGDDVLAVQIRLYELGYLTSGLDGVFGNGTEAAVNAFQLANGLGYCDGMVGNWTLGKLNGNPVPYSPGTAAPGAGSSSGAIVLTRTLKKGMTGDDVLAVQIRLYELGYLTSGLDGIFGNGTEAAVNAFQLANGLGYCDGMVGNWTLSKLNGNPVPYSGSDIGGFTAPGVEITLTRVLSKGMTGDDVLAVQNRLHELGYLAAAPDGIFGGQTEAAVNAFQIANGLGYCDGKVGNWTIGKMNNSPVANW